MRLTFVLDDYSTVTATVESLFHKFMLRKYGGIMFLNGQLVLKQLT